MPLLLAFALYALVKRNQPMAHIVWIGVGILLSHGRDMVLCRPSLFASADLDALGISEHPGCDDPYGAQSWPPTPLGSSPGGWMILSLTGFAPWLAR